MALSLIQSKIPWVLCTGTSVLYFYLFTQVSQEILIAPFESGLMGGFCVWGSPDYPAPPDGCTVPDSSPNNSHMYAWYLDCFMCLIVAAAYFYDGRQNVIMYAALGGIVFLHGLLHFFLNTFVECLTDNLPLPVQRIGWVLYGIFTFLLSAILFGFGFVEQIGTKWVVVTSGLVTAVTVYLASGAGTDWLLSALFATSHPVASITGLFTKSPFFSSTVGCIFLVATLDGILELIYCESFLKQYWGHVWYDFFLHSAVVASLPIFTMSEKKTKTS